MTSLYDFSELDASTRGQPTGDGANRMPEEIFVMDNGKKTYINDKISGFHTLNVSGRELLPYKVNMVHINSYEGNILRNFDHEDRQIKVTYLMETDPDDPTNYRKTFAALQSWIGTGLVQFGFDDDPDYVYEGVLSSVDQPAPGLSTVVSSFTFTCPNPFKKALKPTTVTFVNTKSFAKNDELSAATPVEKIELKPSNDHVTLNSSNGETIALSGVAGKQVEINPQSNSLDLVKVNGNNSPDKLDLMSDLENFAIAPYGKITCDDKSPVSLTFRKRGI